MSNYTFKIETDDIDEIKIYKNAIMNSIIVWELKHNFHRKFKHLEGSEDFYKGIDLVLEKLNEYINEEIYSYNDI